MVQRNLSGLIDEGSEGDMETDPEERTHSPNTWRKEAQHKNDAEATFHPATRPLFAVDVGFRARSRSCNT